MTVVSGDSSGRTQVWDGRTGTPLHSFQQHTVRVRPLLLLLARC
jgi:hypothetical protein